MECRIQQTRVHYAERGAGAPLIALHGAGVDHREIEAAVEPMFPEGGYRRIYPDLPGMGRSTGDGLASNNDVVDLLGDLIDRVAGGAALVLGHSYGAYLARGVAARRPDSVLGLALICPFAGGETDVPELTVVRQDSDAYEELEPGQRRGFDEYFVVRTRATARRYRDHIDPGTALVDEAALERIFSGWDVDLGDGAFSSPSLIVAGRHDATVGYHDAVRLVDGYPHAALAVIDGAGHALLHERPRLLAALVHDWLDRVPPQAPAEDVRG